ncbi:MAG: hypothetical protein MPK62_00900 [Alphaproteobacteria bacterium]|nr:hypothetical protein [Alphaproteobacteria bacterium]MDA8029692.1 hypothetical protein [Alphaproteobacteria bacterium]
MDPVIRPDHLDARKLAYDAASIRTDVKSALNQAEDAASRAKFLDIPMDDDGTSSFDVLDQVRDDLEAMMDKLGLVSQGYTAYASRSENDWLASEEARIRAGKP